MHPPQRRSPHIMVVAGEQSGDQLGAGFIAAIKQMYPDAEIAGVGGAAMAAAGCKIWEPAERLAVMGLWEVLRQLPQLLQLRRDLLRRALAWQPDVFIGIDAPDFNLPLALKLRRAGLKTMHYVSPSVWAWRQNRVHRIRASVDQILTLFPFEGRFYDRHQVPYLCVGHPLVDHISEWPQQAHARRALNAAEDALVLGVLPGSRAGEVARIAPVFLQAVEHMRVVVPNLVVKVAAASPARADQLRAIVHKLGVSDVAVVTGQTQSVLAACDVALVASGTATLETALLQKPMVVGYRFSNLTYWLGRWLVRVPWFSLPNILLDQQVVPELIQHALTAERVAHEALVFLQQPQVYESCRQSLSQLPSYLGGDVDRKVAQAVVKMSGFKHV